MAWVDRSAGLTPDVFTWWLTDTVATGDIDVVYQPLGADDLAASYSNLNDPGTNDASPTVAPSFATTTGWGFTGLEHLDTGIAGNGLQTVIVRFAQTGSGTRTITGTPDVSGENVHMATRIAGGEFLPTSFQYNTVLEEGAIDFFADGVLAFARNKLYRQGVLTFTIGTLATWIDDSFLIAQIIGFGTGRFIGDIRAYAIYNRELTATEVLEISNNMNAIVSTDDPTPATTLVNWIIQNPSTRHLNSTSHELWIATGGGLFRTLDGGRGWAQITLPDPSNDEFDDSPAATINQLTFHWIDYDPSNNNTLYALAAKTSVNRVWVYKTTNTGTSWTSRGVVVS